MARISKKELEKKKADKVNKKIELGRVKERLKKMKDEKTAEEKAESIATESTIDRMEMEEAAKVAENVLSGEGLEKRVELAQKLQGEVKEIGRNKPTRVKLAEGKMEDLLNKKGSVEADELMGIEIAIEEMMPREKLSKGVKKGAKKTVEEALKEEMKAISNLNLSKDKKKELYRKLETASKGLESLVKNTSKYELQQSYKATGADKKVDENVLKAHKRGSKEAIEGIKGEVEEKIQKLEEPVEEQKVKRDKTSETTEKKTKTQQDQGRPPNTKFMKKLEMVEKGAIDESEGQMRLKKTLETRKNPLKEEEIEQAEQVIGKLQTFSLLSSLGDIRELTEEEKEKRKELRNKLS